jgi:hypothetical protein
MSPLVRDAARYDSLAFALLRGAKVSQAAEFAVSEQGVNDHLDI